jgi:glutathione synthase/RimK-type ligase-like ATP-grasp enzyme
VGRFLARSQRPWLNDPAQVTRTRRDLIPTLLGDIPDLMAPAAARISGEAAAQLGLDRVVSMAGLSPPVLVRPIGSHGGRGLVRAESDEALEAAGLEGAGQDLYVTHYCDYQSPDDRYRKGRMIFIDREPYPYHWAIADDWLVHYESAGMGGDAERQAEERAFLADPEQIIGAPAMSAIRAIGKRLDLDYCGVDFSLTPDGRVLVFEANATMFVHPEDPDGEFAYKNAAVRRIIEAFQAHLARRAAADVVFI